MNRDDDPKLWDLLGRTPEPKISPFFARNVLREVRERGAGKRFRAWLNLRRLIPAAGMATALLAVIFVRWHTAVSPLVDPTPDALANDAQDSEVIADLDDLLASDDSNSLDENALL